MAKQELNLTFVDPNPPGALEKQLHKILIDKLLYLSAQKRNTGAVGK